jgi:hypothetical protein
MGNQIFAEKMKACEGLKIANSEHFSLSQMIDKKSLQHFFDKLKADNATEIEPKFAKDKEEKKEGEEEKKDEKKVEEEPKGYREFFVLGNKQTNENLQELVDKRTIKDINDDALAGFSTPNCFKNELKEPSFDKYFTVREVNGDYEDSIDKLFFMKTYVLHTFFEVLKRQSTKESKDFFKEMEEQFKDTKREKSSAIGFETSLRF